MNQLLMDGQSSALLLQALETYISGGSTVIHHTDAVYLAKEFKFTAETVDAVFVCMKKYPEEVKKLFEYLKILVQPRNLTANLSNRQALRSDLNSDEKNRIHTRSMDKEKSGFERWRRNTVKLLPEVKPPMESHDSGNIDELITEDADLTLMPELFDGEPARELKRSQSGPIEIVPVIYEPPDEEDPVDIQLYHVLERDKIPFYFERPELLDHLKQKLEESRLPVVLKGEGGHGKSILALQYIHSRRGSSASDQVGFYYFRAKNIFNLLDGYHNVLRNNELLLKSDEKRLEFLSEEGAKQMCAEYKARFSGLRGVLVFEGACTDLATYLVKPNEELSCIIISSDDSWSEYQYSEDIDESSETKHKIYPVQLLQIGSLSLMERKNILDIFLDTKPEWFENSDESVFLNLLKLVNYLTHPYSLIQAVSLWRHSDITSNEYVTLFEKKIDTNFTPEARINPVDIMNVTFELTFEHVKLHHLEVYYVIELCVLFEGCSVPGQLMCEFVNNIFKPQEALTLQNFKLRVTDILREHQLLTFGKLERGELNFLNEAMQAFKVFQDKKSTAFKGTLDHDYIEEELKNRVKLIASFIEVLLPYIQAALSSVEEEEGECFGCSLPELAPLLSICIEGVEEFKTAYKSEEYIELILDFLLQTNSVFWYLASELEWSNKLFECTFLFDEIYEALTVKSMEKELMKVENEARKVGCLRLKGDVVGQLIASLNIYQVRKRHDQIESTFESKKLRATSMQYLGLSIRLCIPFADQAVSILRSEFPSITESTLLRFSFLKLLESRVIFGNLGLDFHELANKHAAIDKEMTLTCLALGEYYDAKQILGRINEFGGEESESWMIKEPKIFRLFCKLGKAHFQFVESRLRDSLDTLNYVTDSLEKIPPEDHIEFYLVKGLAYFLKFKVASLRGDHFQSIACIQDSEKQFNQGFRVAASKINIEIQGEKLKYLIGDQFSHVLDSYRLLAVDSKLFLYWCLSQTLLSQHDRGDEDAKRRFIDLIKRWSREYIYADAQERMADMGWRLIYEVVSSWKDKTIQSQGIFFGLSIFYSSRFIENSLAENDIKTLSKLFRQSDEDTQIRQNKVRQNIRLMRSVMASYFGDESICTSKTLSSSDLHWLILLMVNNIRSRSADPGYTRVDLPRDLEFLLRLIYQALKHHESFMSPFFVIDMIRLAFEMIQQGVEPYGYQFGVGLDPQVEVDQNRFLDKIIYLIPSMYSLDDQPERWESVEYEYHMLRYRMRRDLGNFTAFTPSFVRGSTESLIRFYCNKHHDLASEFSEVSIEYEIATNLIFASCFYTGQWLKFQIAHVQLMQYQSQIDYIYETVERALRSVGFLPESNSLFEEYWENYQNTLDEKSQKELDNLLKFSSILEAFFQESLYIFRKPGGILNQAIDAIELEDYVQLNTLVHKLERMIILFRDNGMYRESYFMAKWVDHYLSVRGEERFSRFKKLFHKLSPIKEKLDREIDRKKLWNQSLAISVGGLDRIQKWFPNEELVTGPKIEQYAEKIRGFYSGVRRAIWYVTDHMRKPPCDFSLIARDEFASGDISIGSILNFYVLIDDAKAISIEKKEAIEEYFKLFLPFLQAVLVTASSNQFSLDVSNLEIPDCIKYLSEYLFMLGDETNINPVVEFPNSLYFSGKNLLVDNVMLKLSQKLSCAQHHHISKLNTRIKHYTDQLEGKKRHCISAAKEAIRVFCFFAMSKFDLREWQLNEGSNVLITLAELRDKKFISSALFSRFEKLITSLLIQKPSVQLEAQCRGFLESVPNLLMQVLEAGMEHVIDSHWEPIESGETIANKRVEELRGDFATNRVSPRGSDSSTSKVFSHVTTSGRSRRSSAASKNETGYAEYKS